MLKGEGGGAQMFRGTVVKTRELEVLALLMGGANSFTLSGGGGGGSQKVSDPRFSHYVAHPLPVINDQSLRPGACFGRSASGMCMGGKSDSGISNYFENKIILSWENAIPWRLAKSVLSYMTMYCFLRILHCFS